MADYRDHARAFEALGLRLVALSVDEPARSAHLKSAERLPFVLLCDTGRAVVQRFGLYNEAEKGGIARPATFVVDAARKVRFASVDSVRSRVLPADVLASLGGSEECGRREIRPGLRALFRAAGNVLRHGIRSPRG